MANKQRIVSGMRTTGLLHLGHYHGVIKNFIELQDNFECFFFAADLHALTTHYEHTEAIKEHSLNLVKYWLASGVDPKKATIFLQSQVPAHAELSTILSMFTPLSWLERVPSYKDQVESNPNLSNAGFLSYPVLMSADILVYKANQVPIGHDQLSHLEITREITRRFNFSTSKSNGFFDKMELALKKTGKKAAKEFKKLQQEYQEKGNISILEIAEKFLESQNNLNQEEKTDLLFYLQGLGKPVLVEPTALLTEFAKVPGTDGRKMSKSYNNSLLIGEDKNSLEKKIKTMMTDPARVKLTDPGTPEKCPVWDLHKIYSNDETKKWVQEGCTKAKFGCLECKKPVIDSIEKEQSIIRDKLESIDEKFILEVLEEGRQKANAVANQTLKEVKEAVGLLS